MTSERECELCIAVLSDEVGHPELSAKIGSVPDQAWSKGDRYLRMGVERTYQFSRWAVVERASGDDNDWSAAVHRLLARVAPIRETLSSLAPSAVVRFQVFLTENNNVFGFGLTADQLAFLTSVGAALDISVVVETTARPEC